MRHSPWSRTIGAIRQTSRSYSSYTPSPATISSDAEVQAARKYCIETLAKFDTPSFLLRSYVPRAAQDAYLAIRAFNVDVARTADTTSTPTVGAMRLQFQRDAVTKALSGTPPKQPIFILLAKAADDVQARSDGKIKLSRSWLNRIISTREQYLGNPPFPDLAALETYAENTYSTLMYLTLQAMGMTSLTADHVASHIGKAAGIATILKGIPLIAFPGEPRSHSNQQQFAGAVGSTRQGAVLLPLDVMAEHGVREEDVIRQGAGAKGLGDAVFAVATRANDHLITAREMVKNLRAGRDAGHDFEHGDEQEHADHHDAAAAGMGQTKLSPAQEIDRAFGAFMPIVPTSLWLDTLERVDFDLFSPKLRTTDWRLPMKVWWTYTSKRL